MSEEKKKITLDSNIMEVIQQHPHAAEIFMKHGLPCVGCAAAQHEKISDAVAEFGIDGKKLIEEIEKGPENEKTNDDKK